MEDIIDMVRAAVLITLAIVVIVVAFYAVTFIIPIALVAGAIYVIAKLIQDEREDY